MPKPKQMPAEESMEIPKVSSMMINFELGKSAVAVTPKVYPKKAQTSYLFFVNQYNENLRAPDRRAFTQTEAMRVGGSKWGKMSEEEKKPFEKMATVDKARFEWQTEQFATKGFFIMTDGSESIHPRNAYLAKVRKIQPEKEDEEPELLQPKKVITAFLYFNAECSAEIRTKNPGVMMPMVEVSKLVSQKWGAMTDAQKKPYEDKNAADKKRHEQQLEELNKKGYFMLDDGRKSTDVPKVPKKPKSLKQAFDLSKSMPDDSPKAKKPRLSVKQVKERVAKAVAKK